MPLRVTVTSGPITSTLLGIPFADGFEAFLFRGGRV